MRGNPLLRAVLLAIALGLTSVLVAAVLNNSRRPAAPEETTPPPPSSRSTLVPTLLSFTLSAPATSITFTEPSGRTLVVPVSDDGLVLEHESELTVNHHTWQAQLTVEWQDPSRHNFLRLDFEPERLKSSTLTLDFRPHATQKTITTSFNPN